MLTRLPLLLLILDRIRAAGREGGIWLALIVALAAIALLYLHAPAQVGIPLPGDKSINVPREITEVQPQDVACKGAVSVYESAQGLFYRATLGKIVLSWTEALDKAVLTDGAAVDYPAADKAITTCLIKRAKLVEAGH